MIWLKYIELDDREWFYNLVSELIIGAYMCSAHVQLLIGLKVSSESTVKDIITIRVLAKN